MAQQIILSYRTKRLRNGTNTTFTTDYARKSNRKAKESNSDLEAETCRE